MSLDKAFNDLKNIMDKENILLNEPMKNHTSFKVGGPANMLLEPQSKEEISQIIKYLNKNDLKYFVIGNGSNLLIKDGGLDLVVIKIGEKFSDFKINKNKVISKSGALLSVLSKSILKHSLKGFEFASGIPGSLGGAVYMNAGAYGGEMKDIVSKVTVVDKTGEIIVLDSADLGFEYRKSIIASNDYIVVEVELELEEGKYEEIKEYMDELTLKRTTKQPLDMPSAGSTFKRPQGYYAGKLIEDTGLRGLYHRGAQVSEKHCGFVVNKDNANAKDILTLIDIIKSAVYDKFKVKLEEEVRIIGKD
ncbi:MAG: UDP-N-acetylmuramate dehydrogenase [Peptostreptococcaceae bacterium]|jgi:UDP-N-acetylmuramate dehydrogenase|nr:UDP-N-acetylmuramate dehydrogenase [Peptostreptococcaceae bacterium]